MSNDLAKRLRETTHMYQVDCELKMKCADRIEELELKVKNLNKALEIYEDERNRFRHAHPEITGAYFLAGGHGDVDSNMLPEYVRIVPAYGCAWEQVYVKTDKTINYEGS